MSKYFDGYASFDYKEMSKEKLIAELKEKVRYIGELKRNHAEEVTKVQSTRDKQLAELKAENKRLLNENGYLIFADGYDENNNPVHKQIYKTYKESNKELITENKKLKQQLKDQAKEKLNAKRLSIFYRNYNVEIVEINGEAYVCDNDSWNGWRWGDAWQLNEDFNPCNECEIRPLYSEPDEDGDFELIGYEII